MNPTADQQLQSAAYGGDYTACKAAYAQGATNFNKMLYEAARGGHRDLCELALSWVKAYRDPLDTTVYNVMLCGAAFGGHRDLCELAKSWGATNVNGMLYEAARGGHRDLCELAKSWGG